MPKERVVSDHYTHGELAAAIERGVQGLGKTIHDISIDDLAPVDEFHVGGRVATKHFLDQLGIDSSHEILDIGCGLGGASRFAANNYDCRVTGVDLTEEYVSTGNLLCDWVGLGEKVALEVANATALPYQDERFDRAYLLHVGMNIAQKSLVASELYRVLKPGGRIGIYDIMWVNPGELEFPVPWATESAGSAVSTEKEYETALEACGFTVTQKQNRRDFALEFFKNLQANLAKSGGPPPLGLHLLMGDTAPIKIKNMAGGIAQNFIAPIELIAEK